MVVNSLGSIVAQGVGVGQWRTQKCHCLSSWKQNLEEDRNENEAKHLAAKVLLAQISAICQRSLLQLSGFQQLPRVAGKSFLQQNI